MPPETVRLSSSAKNQLITLKQRTGIDQWNILCRWALCLSLAEEGAPRDQEIQTDSSVEMTWKTFGGDYAEVYWAAVRDRCLRDGIEATEENAVHHFKLHLHRGIGYLAGDKKIYSIESLINKAVGK